MKATTIALAVAIPLVVGGSAAAVVATNSGSVPTISATGGYPWAAAACQTPTVSGTLSNGTQGTVCPNDDWEVAGAIYNPESSYGYRNCTDYVAWKVKQTEGVTLPRDVGNASAWGPYSAAHGNPPSDTPEAGDIAWEPGGNHVAYVESVSATAQTVTISEYNEHYFAGHTTWGEGNYDERVVPDSDFQYIHVGTPLATSTSTSPPATEPPPTTPPPTTPPPTTAPTTPIEQPQSAALTPGSSFRSSCVVAWPTAPAIGNGYIQMTMSCEAVPEDRYLFTIVQYNDPNLPITPDTGSIQVIGQVEGNIRSDLGYSELEVLASKVILPS